MQKESPVYIHDFKQNERPFWTRKTVCILESTRSRYKRRVEGKGRNNIAKRQAAISCQERETAWRGGPQNGISPSGIERESSAGGGHLPGLAAKLAHAVHRRVAILSIWYDFAQ